MKISASALDAIEPSVVTVCELGAEATNKQLIKLLTGILMCGNP